MRDFLPLDRPALVLAPMCRKDAGGGLLRSPEMVNRLIGSLREGLAGRFTVKTRLGYTTPEEFPELLEIFRRHAIDGLTIHGRTVVERYQTAVHPERVEAAVAVMGCPVIANGNVVDVASGLSYLARTGAAGLMVGRGAIRNPWIFSQFRAAFSGLAVAVPCYRDLWDYVGELYDEIARETPKFNPLSHVQRMKKTLAYISHGLEGDFEYEMRRVKTPEEFTEVCRRHLDNDLPLPAQPPVGSKLFCGFEALT